MTPLFLELEDVLEMHRRQIAQHGGSSELRDLGLLQSALAMPQAGFGGEYFHTDLYEMAAAYLFHLVKNHPFVDGNKRVGAEVAMVFLDVNGIDVEVSSPVLAETVLVVAEGKLPKPAIAEFFRKHSRRRR